MSDYRTLNPATGELLESFDLATDQELEATLGRSGGAATSWRRRSLAERTELLRRAADLLESEADEHAEHMAIEMGKPLAEGRAEAKKCAWVCRYYADKAEDFLRPRAAESDGSEAWVHFAPLGPIFAVMPWNFPYWQVFRFAAPALAAGNVVLLKHAPCTPRCSRAIERLFERAGAPPDTFRNLYLSNEQAAAVIAHPAVRGVTLTGSTGAGRAVAQAAGRALKPMVMELGGSDPFILFADADLDAAVKTGVASRCLNSGQSCIAAKRFLVHRDLLKSFTDAFVAAMRAKKIGDPLAKGTEIGPLAREDLRDGLARQVEAARKEGANVLTGGDVPSGKGFFYPPTVLGGLHPKMKVAQEEFFGPVAGIYSFADEQEAVAIANATSYGLGASVWTSDRQRVSRLMEEIETGSIFVNGLVKSDPRLPFGGVKESGFGRELGRDGMLEFTNVKTLWVK